MERAKAGLRLIWRVITNSVFVLLGFAFGLTSLFVSLDASNRVADEANQRTQVIEGLYERQRVTFCGVFEPIVEASKSPAQPPRTPIGEQIVRGSQTAISSEGLACTSDPFDGK